MCDRFDLDERARGKLRDLNRRACGWPVADETGVDRVHALEVVEILKEDGRLHELRETRARLGENRCEVRKDLLGLLLDRAAGELLVAGLEGELTRDEHEVSRPDRLGVRRALER